MKKLLAKLTENRFTAAMAGMIITAVIQSSSVTTVLIVGFISANLLTLSQSVRVIIGANIGTTVTTRSSLTVASFQGSVLIDPRPKTIHVFVGIANYLENIGDVIDKNLLDNASKRLTPGVGVRPRRWQC